MKTRKAARSLVGIGLLSILLTTFTARAANSPIAVLGCDTKAELTYTAAGGGVFNWTLEPPNSGPIGTCSYEGGSLQFTSFHGSGTSHGLGTCTGNPVVTDFTMYFSFRVEGDRIIPGYGPGHVVIQATNTLWTGLPSAYPSVMTFTQPGFFFPDAADPAAVGHGMLTSRIYKMCPPNGTSRAQVVFDLPIYNG